VDVVGPRATLAVAVVQVEFEKLNFESSFSLRRFQG
jgi:hypothetical protein